VLEDGELLVAVERERIWPSAQSEALAEWRGVDRDRMVLKYDFVNRRWSGEVEPFNVLTGRFGEPREPSRSRSQRCGRFSTSC
jgi:hypothetical protein